MKNRTYFLAALTCAVLALPARAETVYKISLLDGMQILSATAPVPSGSMLLVKNLSDGSLRAVPAELVSNVSKAAKPLVPASRLVPMIDSARGAKSVIVLPAGQKVSRSLTTAKMARTLTSANLPATLATGKPVHLSDSVSTAKTESGLTLSVNTAKKAAGSERALTTKLLSPLGPGQTIFLGSTGGPSITGTRVDTTVVSPRGSALAASPLGASVQDQIFVGDLPRLTPRSGLIAGTLVPTTGEVVIGPNGFPVPVTATTPASAVQIGPNGFPDFTAAAARSGSQTVGANGFPATATAFSPTGLTRAGGSITTAVPVTAATAATTGTVNTPATIAAPSAAAPAASPR